MDSERLQRWRDADRLFSQWLELEPAQRDAWFGRQEIEAETRAALQRLIAQQEAAGDPPSVLGRIEIDAAGKAPGQNALSGRRLGHWELLEEIGRGGMSVVYRARRCDADFEQVAAVKLLGLAALGSQGSERFEQERRVLARLHHPHIASLIDGGLAEDGTPYLVMPLVEGNDLATHCRELALDWQNRVRLLVQICAAVAHAHQNLLVHRDLKPANILVSGEGVPMLLDFGIAKLLDSEQDATRTGLRAMTPGYAAPEQISGEAITTATDVYALGIILRNLCEDCTSLPADLRNIIAMATRADAPRRYPDARAMGEDLQRLLSGHPVQATPDSTGYRMRAFLRRRRGWVAAAATILLVLAGGLAATLWQARKAELQAFEALRQSERAEAARDFLFNLFEAGNRDQTDGEDPRVSTLVERGARQLDQFADKPELYAEMSTLLARIDTDIGQHERAGKLLDAARSSAERAGDAGLIASVDAARGTLANALGESGEAVELFDAALAKREQAGEADSAFRVYVFPGWVYAMDNLGRQDEAGKRIAGELARSDINYSPSQRGELLLAQSTVTKQDEQRLVLVTEAARQFAEQPASPSTEMTLEVEWGNALNRVGNSEQAIAHARKAVKIADRLYPGPTRYRARTHNNLGSMLSNAGHLAEADADYAEAEAIYRELGDDHTPAFAALANNRGLLLRDLGDSVRGLPLLEQALALASDQFGGSDRRTAIALRNVATLRAEATADPRADQEWLRARETVWPTASATLKFTYLIVGAQIALDINRVDEAQQRLLQADALAKLEPFEMSGLLQIRRLTAQATMSSLKADNQAANNAFTEALRLTAEKDGQVHQQRWRVEKALAESARRNLDPVSAQQHYTMALEALLGIGADPAAGSVVAMRHDVAQLNPSQKQ